MAMKIIIYDNSLKQMDFPVTLSLPDSAFVRAANPFFIPDFDDSFTARPYVAYKVSKLGKSVAGRFASRYIGEVAVVLCITADTRLNALRANGLPWTAATGFDRSVMAGEFAAVNINEPMVDMLNLHIEQEGSPAIDLAAPTATRAEEAVEAVSATDTIKHGDLILVPLIDRSGHQPQFKLAIDRNIKIYNDHNVLMQARIK